MNITQLLHIAGKHPNVPAVSKLLGEVHNISINGLHGSSRALFAAALAKKLPQTYLYLLNDQETAGYFYHDLVQVAGEKNVLFFPSAFKRAAKYGQIDSANEILRTEAMIALQRAGDNSDELIIVSYPDAVAEYTISQQELNEGSISLSVGEKVDCEFVSRVLDEYGFEYVDYVYEPGQYAMRGSILDVFSYSNEYPYRVDFFGDEVETIRSFEVETQLSNRKMDRVQIVPRFGKSKSKDASFFDFLPANTVIGMDNIKWFESRIESISKDMLYVNVDEDEFVKTKLLTSAEFSDAVKQFKMISFSNTSAIDPDALLEYTTSSQPLYHKNFELLSSSLRRYIDGGYTIYILSDSEKQQQRLRDIFDDRGDNIPFEPVDRTLHEGFIDDVLKICCFTDHQIFDRYHKYDLKSDRARSGKLALTLKEINQFMPGDYVVHIDHGVGKFAGLVRMPGVKGEQEVIKLTYLNNDVVFVSIHSLHKISKYKGREGEAPKLNKLGSGAWERVKERTKSKIKDIARDLINLYSKRQQEMGFAFSKDTYMQAELEASFMYEDTPDQTKTMQDIRQDMENSRPMDRLVCGDVGFGKTEVAIRAAFKAVADSKQVAVLVPTTVLATQHYNTFSKRLKDFPCRVDYISRARTTKEKKEILDDLKEGRIDIIIGTHSLTGKGVKFKDLGLLIIDEEQKFGVSVKEKLKQIKVNVDTLTLTATPIPRTLQFSLMGSRDMSVISTPPPNRYPVQTEVHAFDVNIIKDAIIYEINRNGQVFIINNRVQNIHEIEVMLKREISDIRIAVAHGQMEPKKLEQVIEDFLNMEYDVLLATSIIESGIDMPNVNTIIVNNAQNFGLSDLHQLRGRVGRSNRKAFCYLLAPPLHYLSADARRRLQAIENFSELGSGIHIAMQDLDIRGAGNLLGAEQSGFIADLGYETYQKILAEAVTELRKEEFREMFDEEQRKRVRREGSFVDDVSVESDLELMFPVSYIPNDSERVGLYRELDNTENEADVIEFIRRLEDRFGKIPPQGKELIRVVELRRTAKEISIEKLMLKNKEMKLILISDSDSLYYQSAAFGKLLDYVQHNPRRCTLRELNSKRSVVIKNVGTIKEACDILKQINEINIESDEQSA